MSGSRDRLKNYEKNKLVIEDVFSDVSFGQLGFNAVGIKSTLMVVHTLNLKILLNGIYVMEICYFFGTAKDSDRLNVLCCGQWSVLNCNHRL